jgi:hypothetical protein
MACCSFPVVERIGECGYVVCSATRRQILPGHAKVHHACQGLSKYAKVHSHVRWKFVVKATTVAVRIAATVGGVAAGDIPVAAIETTRASSKPIRDEKPACIQQTN